MESLGRWLLYVGDGGQVGLHCLTAKRLKQVQVSSPGPPLSTFRSKVFPNVRFTGFFVLDKLIHC